MLKVAINHARIGMELAMAVYHPVLPGHVLLRPGFALDGPTLARLAELRVRSLWIKYPALDSVVKYVSPEIVSEHASLTSTMGRALERVRDPMYADLDFKTYASAVRSLLAQLNTHPDAAILVNDLVSSESPLVMHSGNVCFISLLMGLKLEAYLIEQRKKVHPSQARNVENLGVGGLLHDIGMLRLEPDVHERWIETGDVSDPAFQRHVRLGYEMVRGKVEPTAAVVVLHHHQRYDGRGFPGVPDITGGSRGLRGEGIHVFARIVAVADLYDRLRHPPAGEGDEDHRIPSVRVLRQLLDESRHRHIDPIVFKALVNVVPAYAPGTIVKLSNQQTAVVTGTNPLEPCRPPVRQILGNLDRLDPQDEKLGAYYDLSRWRGITIVQADGVDVHGDNFDPIDPTEFDLRVLSLPRTKPFGVRDADSAAA